MDITLDEDFEVEIVGFSTVKNNGFDVDTVDFCDVKDHVGVKSIEAANSKQYKPSKSVEYIELDENILKNKKKKLSDSSGDTVIDTIEFNALRGCYTISYHELGKTKTEEYFIDKKELHINELKKKEKFAKWGKKSKKLNKIDINLYTVLSRFDKKHNSFYVKEYFNNNTSYITNYCMGSIFKNREYSFKEKIGLIRMANRQKKYRNSNVENPKGISVAPILVSVALLLGIFSVSAPNSKNKTLTSNSNNNQIEHDEDEVTMNSSEVHNSVNSSEKTNVETTKSDFMVIEKDKNQPVNIEEDENNKVITDNSIHDSFVLDEMDLEYSPIENIKHVNTSNLDYVDNYKISLVSVYDGDNVICNEKIDNIEDKTINELIDSLNDKYGVETKKYVNWNGFDQDNNIVLEYVGWSNIENLKSKDISYSNEQIQKLERAKKTLLSLTSNDSSKGYQKLYTKKEIRR